MQRNRNYDIIRVVAIIMVICIHSMRPLKESLTGDSITFSRWCCFLYDAVISAGVPMFFMLSGALLLGKEESWLVFYKRKLKRILIPFVLWSVVVYALSIVIRPCDNGIEYIKNFFVLMFTRGVNEAYWFVYMLMSFYVLVPLCRKILKRVTHYGIGLICVMLAYLVGFYLSMFVPMTKDICHWFCCFCMFIGGFMCSKVHFRFVGRFWIVVILLLIAAYSTCLLYQIHFIPWTLIYAYSLFIYLNQLHFNAEKNDAVTMLSRNSYGIYLSHVIFCGCLVRYSMLLSQIPPVIAPILLTLIVISIEYGLMLCIEKIGWSRFLC